MTSIWKATSNIWPKSHSLKEILPNIKIIYLSLVCYGDISLCQFSLIIVLSWPLRAGFCLTPWLLLQQCKLGIVKFIEAKQVPEVETVVHLAVASSDTRHSVATAADLELRSKQR